MSESDFWDRIRNGMGGRWHAQRHEDKYSTGIPDVSFGIKRLSEGWIELKFLPTYPAKSDVKKFDFAIDHFTADQRNWLTLRTQHGTGRVFLFVQMGNVSIIWRWAQLAPLLGKHTLKYLEGVACGSWSGPVDYDELAQILIEGKRIPRRFRASDIKVLD